MKKIIIILTALIMVFALVMPPEQAKAAVVSKVAQKAVFKVVKEVAKDKAIEQSFSMVMNYKYVPKEEREAIKKADAGFTMVCLPENRKNDICEKPIQVKNSFTTADKKAIASKVEGALDSKTGNKGFLKIVNWFVPVWIVGSAYTITDLLVDGDISSFFADLGYDALVSLGFIKPLGKDVTKKEYDLIFDPSTEPDATDKGIAVPGGTVPVYLGSVNNSVPKIPVGITSNSRIDIQQYTNLYTNHVYGVQNHWISFTSDRPYLYDNLNVFQYKNLLFQFNYKPIGSNYKTKKLDTISVFRSEYNHTASVTKGLVVLINVQDENIYLNRPYSIGLNKDEMNHYMNLVNEKFFGNLVESYPEPLPQIKPVDVPVITPGTTTKVPSPSAVPVKDKTTGKTVKPTKTSVPGDITWTDKDGNIIPEENIIVEDLIIEETPNGTIIKNPDPSGNPEMQDGLTPNPEKAPPVNEDLTEEDLEKMSCARLKKIDFKPFTSAITTSFPFSIPWDLQRAFNNAFSQIGDERPNFSYDFTFNGQQHSWEIGFPKFFDSWLPFTKGLLLLGFDIGLIYAIYRFTKGGGD